MLKILNYKFATASKKQSKKTLLALVLGVAKSLVDFIMGNQLDSL